MAASVAGPVASCSGRRETKILGADGDPPSSKGIDVQAITAQGEIRAAPPTLRVDVALQTRAEGLKDSSRVRPVERGSLG